MIAQFTRILVPAAVALAVGLSLQSANAAPIDSTPAGTAARSHDVFSEGLRQGSFNPYDEGAHGNGRANVVAARAHDVFTQGLRDGRFDPYSQGGRGAGESALVAGMDRSGVSASPARQFDPYADGARTVDGDPRTGGAALARVPALI